MNQPVQGHDRRAGAAATARTLLTARGKEAVRGALRSRGYEIAPLATSFVELQRRLLARCDLLVDVGANTGQYVSLVRSLGYTGRVLSFEPQRQAYEVLRRVAAAPGWEPRRVALSHSLGAGTLRVSANSVSSSLLDVGDAHLAAAPRSVHVGDEEVSLSTVDRELAAERFRAAWLKLDVQGTELDVLRGSVETLPHVAVVQTELSLTELYAGQADYLQMCAVLREHGLHLRHLQPGFQDPASGNLLQVDGLFTR
jgi:FkbM family methyltransferase